MTTLQVNDVLHFIEDGHRERLLWLNPAKEGGWFINIDQSAAVPIWRRESELDEFLTAKLVALATDPWAGSGVAITEVQVRRRDEAWNAIKPLVYAQPNLFQSQKRAALIDARIMSPCVV